MCAKREYPTLADAGMAVQALNWRLALHGLPPLRGLYPCGGHFHATRSASLGNAARLARAYLAYADLVTSGELSRRMLGMQQETA